MDTSKQTFSITVLRSPYAVSADIEKTTDDIWASEKCWFMRGDHVLIKDEKGNMKEFVKE